MTKEDELAPPPRFEDVPPHSLEPSTFSPVGSVSTSISSHPTANVPYLMIQQLKAKESLSFDWHPHRNIFPQEARKHALDWTVTGSTHKPVQFVSELTPRGYIMGDLSQRLHPVSSLKTRRSHSSNDVFAVNQKIASFAVAKDGGFVLKTADPRAWGSIEECVFIVGTALVEALTLEELRAVYDIKWKENH
ncbi:UNVERIFIED_CONTAM: hypothetical protein HDU68_002908 [Siphonaria sp. JEL0065]|nr:hypothetical protein HDU68_002908 [Siphonaria sp. JEL0065]